MCSSRWVQVRSETLLEFDGPRVADGGVKVYTAVKHVVCADPGVPHKLGAPVRAGRCNSRIAAKGRDGGAIGEDVLRVRLGGNPAKASIGWVR